MNDLGLKGMVLATSQEFSECPPAKPGCGRSFRRRRRGPRPEPAGVVTGKITAVALASIIVGCSGSSNNSAVPGQGGGISTNTGGNATAGASQTGGTVMVATAGTRSSAGGSAAGGTQASTEGADVGGTNASAGGAATGGATENAGGMNASAGGAPTGGATGNEGGTKAGTGGSTSTLVYQLPTANAGFDYQIGGAYTPPPGVQVVSRDRNSAPAAGLYNICYVNGFQVQPDEGDFWRTQHPDLLLRDSAGNVVVDIDWDEALLDTSTPAKRTALASVIGAWITKCASDGFNAVEVDNLDSYSRSIGLLTQANNVAMMALLSATAHANGLALAQKNSTELLGNVAEMGTDFAIAEECNRYDECADYQAVYGNLVFDVEYQSQDFQKGCTDHPELSIVLRDPNVSPAGLPGYVYQGC